MKGLFKEFKEFISRGNVLDMAVGIIIGSAFTSIVNSLVNDIIMPLISSITGGVNFNEWNFVLGIGDNPPTINFGNFLSAVVNFILIALVLFLIIKSFNKVHELNPLVDTEPEAEKTKICPYCKSEIDIDAIRCPHCTTVLKRKQKSDN